MRLRVTVTALLLLLVCLPRFNMWDPGPIGRWTAAARNTPWGHPIDVEGYARLVEYARGREPAGRMLAPFAYRPLAPAIAARMPGSATTAINLLNVASLLAVLLLLEQIGRRAGLGGRGRWAAGLMFACSFPAFYYGAIGFIDPVAMMLATLFLLLILGRAPTLVLVVVMSLAVLAKETNAVFALLPLGFAFARDERGRGAATRTALFLLAAAGTYLLCRVALPFPPPVFHPPQLQVAMENLARPRTYLSLALTVGVPAGLAWLAWRSGRARSVVPDAALAVLLPGVGLASGLYVYSIFSAHADGRIIWMAYPFLVPIAATWFEPGDSP